MYIRTSSLSYLRVILQGFVDPIMQQSSEVQNNGINDPTKRTDVLENLSLKKPKKGRTVTETSDNIQMSRRC